MHIILKQTPVTQKEKQNKYPIEGDSLETVGMLNGKVTQSKAGRGGARQNVQ